MHLLYLDESGNENDPNDRYFVLGGLALFERQTFFLTKDIEEIQDKHFPNKPPIPFHASEIRSGRNLWRHVDNTKRAEVLTDLSTAIMNSPARGRVLFAAAVEKTRDVYGEAAVARATEEICRRFDTLLQRRFQRDGDPRPFIAQRPWEACGQLLHARLAPRCPVLGEGHWGGFSLRASGSTTASCEVQTGVCPDCEHGQIYCAGCRLPQPCQRRRIKAR